MTSLSKGRILPLNSSVADVIESLLASKHKTSTRCTYTQNLKYFAHYLLNGLKGASEKVVGEGKNISGYGTITKTNFYFLSEH